MTSKIDYTKLSDRIVEQCWEHASLPVLSEAQKQQLIDNKLDRARQYKEALDNKVI